MKREFILDWFSSHSTMSREEIEKNLAVNYLEEGLIDSFAFLEMITTCEETFGISFSDDDFSDERIFSIDGLIHILENKA